MNKEFLKKRLEQNVGTRIGTALKRARLKRIGKIEMFLGCSLDFYLKYLESNFKSEMSWKNYGVPHLGKNWTSSDCWVIDHIKPCVFFDLRDINQIRECFHFTNTQPLFFKDNSSKVSKDRNIAFRYPWEIHLSYDI